MNILDTDPEPAFDSLTRLAALTFDVPIAIISLIDAERQWFKACIGLDVRETSRDVSFCDHAIRGSEVMVIPDAALDARFAANELVTGHPGIRFYAGAPLTLSNGTRIGALCVIDSKPRADFDAQARGQLAAMAETVSATLSLRHDNARLNALERSRVEQDRLLAQAEEMAGVGYWSWWPATDSVTWSPVVYSIHGFDPSLPPPNLEGVLALYDPRDATELSGLIARALEHGEPYSLNARITRPDGEQRQVTARGEVNRNPDGSVERLFGSFMDVTEVALADQRLRENEARLTFLTEHFADVIIRVEPGRGITWVSPSCARLGYRPEDLVGLRAAELVHPDDLPRAEALRAARLAGLDDPPGTQPTFRFRKADGSWIWVEGSPTIVRDAAGAPIEIVNVLRDISDRKAVEARLLASETRYRLLAENATDVIACYSPDGRFSFLSPAIASIMGYEPDELLGQSVTTFMHPDDVGPVIRRFAEFVSAGPGAAPLRFEYRARRKDGREVWLEGQPRPIFDEQTGDLVEFQDCVRDITDRKCAEFALAESELRYRVVSENSSDLLTRTTISGDMIYASASLETITGFTFDELSNGQPRFIDRLHPDDAEPCLAEVRRVIAGDEGSAARLSFRFQRKDGEWIWLESTPTLVKSLDRPAEIVDLLRDVSARAKIEADLKAARDSAESAAQSKADFLANMSHEIRTPLTAILGFSGLLSEDAELSDRSAGFVRRVSDASRALLTIVNDILDFSKIEAGQMEFDERPVAARDMLDGALQLLSWQAESKGLTLDFVPGPDLPAFVRLDQNRVTQVLLNLISNAVKFTDSGGVVLEARHDPVRETLRLTVRDTGPGLTPQQQQQLFKRFSQVDSSSERRHGGTGLGLAICRGLVEAMGGTIGVESKVGQGSAFTFEIPAPEEKGSMEHPPVAAEDAILAGARILVVDDNAMNRELARTMLKLSGAEVTEAEDGAGAIRAARAAPLDLILMDIRMPDMNGFQALQAIRSGSGPNVNIPILAFSADVHVGAHGAPTPFDGLVRKPISPSNLIGNVVEALSGDDRLGQEVLHHAG
nr:PAS domain S-box protein [Caulobacter sp. SLTY]